MMRMELNTLLFASLAFGIASAPLIEARASGPNEIAGHLRNVAVMRDISPRSVTQIKQVGNETTIINVTTRQLIEFAYSLKHYHLKGGPAWLDSERFDIVVPSVTHNPISNAAIRTILFQEFHLSLKQVTKPGLVLALVLSNEGSKFPPTTPANASGSNGGVRSTRIIEEGGQREISITGTLSGLAEALSAEIDQPIVDETGLTGTYDINFHWSASASATRLSAELKQQLGLMMAYQEDLLEFLVIDGIMKPDLK